MLDSKTSVKTNINLCKLVSSSMTEEFFYTPGPFTRFFSIDFN